jgi:hypothetical protein
MWWASKTSHETPDVRTDATVNLTAADVGKNVVLAKVDGDQTVNLPAAVVGYIFNVFRGHAGDGYLSKFYPTETNTLQVGDAVLSAGAGLNNSVDTLGKSTFICRETGKYLAI